MYSKEHQIYLKKLNRNKKLVLFSKIFIFILFIIIWEILAKKNILNTFLTSSPTEIIKTIIKLYKQHNLFNHIWTTLYETIVSFSIASITGLIIASIIWHNKTLYKIIDPYLTILNSLPKVSLGPLVIIILGANIKSIILMAFLITVFTSIINMYNAFTNTDKDRIVLLKSFGASKTQIFTKLVLRGNLRNIINALKVNISLSLIGVIMGELLVSKQGLGYLITYGSQIFNLNLIITSIFILGVISYLLYISIDILEKKINK